MTPRAISLYRSILKAHGSKLPADLRQLGNAYVRNEFKLHKTVTHEQRLADFYQSWDEYLQMMAKQTPRGKVGREMRENERKYLSDEQKDKLVELQEEIKKDINEVGAGSNSRSKPTGRLDG